MLLVSTKTTSTTMKQYIDSLTYRFPYNFWNCFFQSCAVCGQTRVDIDFN